MGVTVRQKVKGRGNAWWVFIHHRGKLRSKKVGDRAAANRLASELRRRLKAGELSLDTSRSSETEDAKRAERILAKDVPGFEDYALNHYLEKYAKVACKWSTWTGYEQMIRDHLLPVWSEKRLDRITRTDVKRLLLAKQQAGYSPSTVNNIRVLISGIFTHAYEDEILAVNPALKMGKFVAKSDRRAKVNPITGPQVTKLLDACHRHYPQWHTLILCAFRTGMRMGELMGLALEDIDLEAKRIEVRRGYSHGRFSTPKSHKGRVVDMSDQLCAGLAQHKRRMEAWHRVLPAISVPTGQGRAEQIRPVFTNEQGNPVDGDNFRRRVFYPLLEKANVPRMRFHDIRHTFASLLLQNGESLHYVKEQMGHASIQTTVDVYGHLVPGSNRQAVNRLDDPPPPEVGPTEVDPPALEQPALSFPSPVTISADPPRLRLVGTA